MSNFPVHIMAEASNEEVEHVTRYFFSLYSSTGVKRDLIVDVPLADSDSTDVWVGDSSVQVGDTPQDGFATFTPGQG